VLEETVVFGRQEGLLELRRNLLEPQRDATLLAESAIRSPSRE
jgi:hypothetical protein